MWANFASHTPRRVVTLTKLMTGFWAMYGLQDTHFQRLKGYYTKYPPYVNHTFLEQKISKHTFTKSQTNHLIPPSLRRSRKVARALCVMTPPGNTCFHVSLSRFDKGSWDERSEFVLSSFWRVFPALLLCGQKY